MIHSKIREDERLVQVEAHVLNMTKKSKDKRIEKREGEKKTKWVR